MLINRSRLLFEGWISFDKGLHVLNRLNFLCNLLLTSEVFHQLFYIGSNLSKVQIHIVGIKVILLSRQHHFGQLFWNTLRGSFCCLGDKKISFSKSINDPNFNASQIDAVIVDC